MKSIKREDIFRYILAIVTATFLVIACVAYPQSPLIVAPLFVSIVVMFLQSSANRYTYLLGGLNSILYAVAYLLMSLYGVALQALLVSFPLQIWTFFRWKKNAYKSSTVFKRLTGKQYAVVLVVSAVCCVGGVLALRALGSENSVLDTLVTVISTISAIFSLLSYIEYVSFSLCSAVLTVVLHAMIIRSAPAQLPYLIYSIYSVVCVALAFLKTRSLYREQQREKKEK
ncbi:MAG: nicotinamide riboside transporter PnuC [Clostridia bacterium]|nr:nicotinamide riboside transporter PnuC [Clostridia bacterium]